MTDEEIKMLSDSMRKLMNEAGFIQEFVKGIVNNGGIPHCCECWKIQHSCQFGYNQNYICHHEMTNEVILCAKHKKKDPRSLHCCDCECGGPVLNHFYCRCENHQKKPRLLGWVCYSSSSSPVYSIWEYQGRIGDIKLFDSTVTPPLGVWKRYPDLDEK